MNDLKCIKCGGDNIVESIEDCVDYYVVGTTYRCKDCGWGYGHIDEPRDDWKEVAKKC